MTVAASVTWDGRGPGLSKNSKGKATEDKAPKWGSSEGKKGCGEPVETQPIVLKALRRQEVDFQSPGGQGTGQKARGAKLQEQEARGPGLNEASILGRAWVEKPQELKKILLGHHLECPQGVQSPELA
jgi:hypothetical protein